MLITFLCACVVVRIKFIIYDPEVGVRCYFALFGGCSSSKEASSEYNDQLNYIVSYPKQNLGKISSTGTCFLRIFGDHLVHFCS